mgnify:CR=1 FL=1
MIWLLLLLLPIGFLAYLSFNYWTFSKQKRLRGKAVDKLLSGTVVAIKASHVDCSVFLAMDMK